MHEQVDQRSLQIQKAAHEKAQKYLQICQQQSDKKRIRRERLEREKLFLKTLEHESAQVKQMDTYINSLSLNHVYPSGRNNSAHIRFARPSSVLHKRNSTADASVATTTQLLLTKLQACSIDVPYLEQFSKIKYPDKRSPIPQKIKLNRPQLLVGKGNSCHIQLYAKNIEETHAIISTTRHSKEHKYSVQVQLVGPNAPIVVNGTLLNYMTNKEKALHDGDILTLGSTRSIDAITYVVKFPLEFG